MKKALAILFALVMLLGMLPLCAFADDGLTDNKGHSVDIVIIMDMSDSMRYDGSRDSKGNRRDRTGTDPNSNRTVAAEMITAMCDMNGSRVAFVPFNRTITEGTFVDISDLNSANGLRTTISGYDNRQVRGGTDYGSALAYAYNLLISRDDAHKQNNNPMIILLTDGDNAPEEMDEYFLWNESEGQYAQIPASTINRLRTATYRETIANDPVLSLLVDYDGTPLADITSLSDFKEYDGDDADKLVRDVTMRCQAAGIPIYTVPLYSDNKSGSVFISLLKELSDITGAKSHAISTSNADQLPFFFADLFADQIGSSQRPLPVRATGEENWFEVDIPLLNSSVQEANIYIPLNYVDANSIRLIDSTGADRYPDKNSIVRIEKSGAFVLYKLRVKEPLGMWKLRFRTLASKTDVTPADLSFSLLYNYNITLTSTVNSASSNVSAGKSSTLNLVSCFFDNSTGAKSTDTNLYQPSHPGLSEEDIITFTYQLLNASRQPLSGSQAVEGAMTYDASVREMTASIDLASYNLSAGDYYIRIVADGAGLHRENLIPITLTNTAPSALSTIHGTFNVETGSDQATYSPQSLTFQLTDYVSDPDHDALTFSNLQTTSGNDIAVLTLSGSTLEMRTMEDSSTGHFAYGTQTGTIDVRDDDMGLCQLEFTIQISSGWALASDCIYVTTPSGMDNGSAEKNSEISFSMTPVTRDGVAESVALLTGSAEIIDNATGSSLHIDMTPNADSSALVCAYTTGNTAADLTAKFTYYYNGEEIASDSVAIRVNNSRPVARTTEEAAALFPAKLTYNASFFSFIEQENPTATIDLAHIFSDADNETGLEFYMDDSTPVDAGMLECVISGSTLTITGRGAGSIPFTVAARDGDGETAAFTYTIKVVNLFVFWGVIALIILAVIILIIVLLLMIRQRNKPRLPENGTLVVTIGNSLYATNSQPTFTFYNIHNPKDPLALNSVVTLDTCDAVQFEYAELSGIKLCPVKASENLRVLIDKKPGTFIVKLDNDDAKVLSAGKSRILKPGQELTLQGVSSPDPEHCLHISYLCSASAARDAQYDPDQDMPSAFGGDTSLSDSSSAFETVSAFGDTGSAFSSSPMGESASFGGEGSFGDSSFGENNAFGGDSSFGDSNSFGENASFGDSSFGDDNAFGGN